MSPTPPSINKNIVAEQRELLLLAWKSATASRKATYISGPMNTGLRFYEWYVSVGHSLRDTKAYEAEHKRCVLDPNSADIKTVAAKLRSTLNELVIEPSTLNVPGWSQTDYITLWSKVIETLVQRIVLLPQWEFSIGCAQEALKAIESGLELCTPDGAPISASYVVDRLTAAAATLDAEQVPIRIGPIAERARALLSARAATITSVDTRQKRKDELLNELAKVANVAQFVSFVPSKGGLRQAYSRILDLEENVKFISVREALVHLIQKSSERSINLRTFVPGDIQSKPFVYGLKNVDEAEAKAKEFGARGLHVIANETIDINDGGVSGVVASNVIEFAPEDTPRAVEKPGIVSLPRTLGLQLLGIVYSFEPELGFSLGRRVEFSIHPQRRGWRHSHTLCWEISSLRNTEMRPSWAWPNRFSEFIGDKAYGLLVAHLIGLPVPRTTVIGRKCAPFTFGRDTRTAEIWTRTCPRVQVPGKFTSAMRWMDPYELLHREDPNGDQISSILSQLTVNASYSGAAIVSANGDLIVEGVAGWGDRFMQGEVYPEELPCEVRNSVEDVYRRARATIGPVRFEWVYDRRTESTWVVQLHVGSTKTTVSELYPGAAERWVRFKTSDGLEALRDLLGRLAPRSGVELDGKVGVTSHVADLIRKAEVPARFVGHA